MPEVMYNEHKSFNIIKEAVDENTFFTTYFFILKTDHNP